MNTICRLPDSVLLSYFASLSKILSSRDDFFAKLDILHKKEKFGRIKLYYMKENDKRGDSLDIPNLVRVWTSYMKLDED